VDALRTSRFICSSGNRDGERNGNHGERNGGGERGDGTNINVDRTTPAADE
jgi:hypothetical protein